MFYYISYFKKFILDILYFIQMYLILLMRLKKMLAVI